MRALVMAAGLGTRLKPLTDSTPKPLVLLAGRPMVAYVLDQLAREGIKEAIINIHYLPKKMRAFVAEWNGRGGVPQLTIQDETAQILGSGGSVAQAAPWLFAKGSYALVCNADVLAAPDLRELAATHERLAAGGVEVTLAAMAHPEAGKKYNGLRVEGGLVKEFVPAGTSPDPLLHFPGYYIVSAAAVQRLPLGREYSVVDELWKPLAREGKLGAFYYHGLYQDLGTVADLKAAEELLDP